MIFRAINKWSKRVRAVRLWHKAEMAAANGEFVKSLSLLRSIYDIFASHMPSNAVVSGINMLCGVVAQKTGDYRMAAEAARIALTQIDTERGLSDYDKDYLRYHCKMALIYCGRKLNVEEIIHESASINVEFSDLKREKIRTNLLRYLPIQEWNVVN